MLMHNKVKQFSIRNEAITLKLISDSQFLKIYQFLFLCVWMLCLNYVCVPCVYLVSTEGRRYPLRVELQMVVNCHLSPLEEQPEFLTIEASLQPR